MNLTAIQGNIVSMRGNLLAMDARKPFIIEVDTTKGNGFNTFTLPLTNHFTDVYVKTSDGQRFTISNYLDPNLIINFASAGVYTIELRGQCGWSFNNTGDCQKLTKVISWGDFLFNYLRTGFYGCVNLGLGGGLPLTGSINAPSVTLLEYTFRSCNLTNVGSTDLLKRCGSVTSITGIFNFNVLNILPERLLQNCPLITNFTLAFSGNLLVSVPYDLFKYCPLATEFYACLQQNLIESLPDTLLHFSVNAVNFRNFVFGNKLSSLPATLLLYCTKATNFWSAFEQNLIETLPATLLSSCVLADNLRQCFYKNRLISIPQGFLDNNINITNLLATFQTNKILSIGNGLFYYTRKVTNYRRVLYDAFAAGYTLPSVLFYLDTNTLMIVTDWSEALAASSEIGRVSGTVQDVWNYASPTSIKDGCFLKQTQLTNYNDIPNEWKGL